MKHTCVLSVSTSSFLSHAMKNTANQRARKPLHILRYATGRIHEKIPAFIADSKFSRRKWSSFAILTGEADFSVNN